jgi:hypothetical protein
MGKSHKQGKAFLPSDSPHPNPLPEGEGTLNPRFAILKSLTSCVWGWLDGHPTAPYIS